MDVVRQIIEAEKGVTDPAAVRTLLDRLAVDDFAPLRSNPPLLYHNDLTASVSRYYWSEDFGYALWMRLAAIYARSEKSDATG